MNKNESKYFNTAIKMDQAFLELLEKKDFALLRLKRFVMKQMCIVRPFIYEILLPFKLFILSYYKFNRKNEP